LRGGSNYTVQPKGQSPAQFLKSVYSGSLSRMQEALNDLYQVGRIVLVELSHNWVIYENRIP